MEYMDRAPERERLTKGCQSQNKRVPEEAAESRERDASAAPMDEDGGHALTQSLSSCRTRMETNDRKRKAEAEPSGRRRLREENGWRTSMKKMRRLDTGKL